MKTIFVTGTDTEVGKTYVAAKLAEEFASRQLRVGVYKPVASDCIPFDQVSTTDLGDTIQDLPNLGLVSMDAVRLWNAAQRPLDLHAVCPQRFFAPLAPDVAAQQEGKTVDQQLLVSGTNVWRGKCDVLIVEGAGGLFSPLAGDCLNIDFANELDNPVIVLVAANKLGCMHQVISTVRAALHSDREISTIYLSNSATASDPSMETNAKELRKLLPEIEIVELGYGESPSTLPKI